MIPKSSWMGIDIGPVDITTVFNKLPGQRDGENPESKEGWQWIGDTKYPDPYSRTLLQRYPDRPFIIGFHRCGRHWMSLVLECYFEEAFVFEDTPWSGNAKLTWPKVLYLHIFPPEVEDYPAKNFVVQYRRDPVAVVFSFAYKKQILQTFNPEKVLHCDLEDPTFFMVRATDYGQWLDKYLFRLEPKDFYTYEDMLQDMPSVLRKICSLVGEEFNEESCARVIREVTKEKCRELIPGLSKPPLRTERYEDLKREFYSRYADLIWDTVTLPGPQ